MPYHEWNMESVYRVANMVGFHQRNFHVIPTDKSNSLSHYSDAGAVLVSLGSHVTAFFTQANLVNQKVNEAPFPDGQLLCRSAFSPSFLRNVLLSGLRGASLSTLLKVAQSMIIVYNSIDRIFPAGWCPNNQDMLWARLRTTGINETFFQLGYVNWRMIDVGGQRSERRKWIHCFEDLECIVLSRYPVTTSA